VVCSRTTSSTKSPAMSARQTADFSSPTHFAGITGSLKSFLDRCSCPAGASSAEGGNLRSGGAPRGRGDVVHQLNDFLELAETVIPPSQYWTLAFGMEKASAAGRRRHADAA
jgi:multimeric flavodoxin WrbA